jgi:hypothetical protein
LPLESAHCIFSGETMKTATAFQAGWQPARWLAILWLVLLFIGLRWNNCSAPLTRDEGEYAYAGQRLLHGELPYENVFTQKPPMVFYSYALADLLLPQVFWSPRLLACGFMALATALLGFIARREFGRGFALPAMWLMTPLVLLPGVEQFTANTEMFLLLPLVGVFAAYSEGRRRDHRPKYWFAAGLLAVTALLYKYTALPLVAFVFAVWSVEQWQAKSNVPSFVRCWGAALLGGILATAVELGLFLWHDGGAALWDCTVKFNSYYVASDNFSWLSATLKLKSFWSAWWILFLLAGAAFLKPRPRLWFWAGAFLCAGVATGASYYGQYYLLLIPFWTLLAVAGIHALAEIIAARSTLSLRQIQVALTALAVLLVCLPDAPWLTLSPKTFAAAKLANRSVFLESPIVARRVAELSSPTDYVWVAASEPQILFYARRQSPTRFTTVYELVISSPMREQYQAEAIREVQAHPPKLVVWARSWLQEETRPSPLLLFLNDTLARDYRRVGGYLIAGEDSRWAEPLSDADVPAASVILFQRKTPAPDDAPVTR